jgi:hypothetical protein
MCHNTILFNTLPLVVWDRLSYEYTLYFRAYGANGLIAKDSHLNVMYTD